MQKRAQAGYHPQGLLSKLQKLQHHFLCRGHTGVLFVSNVACRVVAQRQIKL